MTATVNIGAVFPFFKTSGTYDSSGPSRFAAFKLALEEVNADSALLPNTELRFALRDSKRNELAATAEAAMPVTIVVASAPTRSACRQVETFFCDIQCLRCSEKP